MRKRLDRLFKGRMRRVVTDNKNRINFNFDQFMTFFLKKNDKKNNAFVHQLLLFKDRNRIESNRIT